MVDAKKDAELSACKLLQDLPWWSIPNGYFENELLGMDYKEIVHKEDELNRA